MIGKLRWIGSLPTLLNAKLDSVVSAELHALTTSICRRAAGKHLRGNEDLCAFAHLNPPASAPRASKTASGGSRNDKIAA